MKMMTAKSALTYGLIALGTSSLIAQGPLTSPSVGPAVTAPAVSSGPRIQFQNTIYDFGKIKSGELVKYTFTFTNTGDAVLILTNVQPQCGCTTAGEWTRQVEPGKTGAIPIQFSSANYGGQVVKTVTITSNDKNQPSVGLQLKGTVWKPINVQPMFAVLNITAHSAGTVTTTAHIVNNMEEPITLSPPESNNKSFAAELKTNIAGKDFQVIISAVPPFDQANRQGQITLKTSSTNMPVISITAWANVQEAIAATASPAK